MSQDLSIIIPTFNEEGNISAIIEAIKAVLPESGWEIIFVDDNSSDNTIHIIREHAHNDPRIRGIRRIGRKGLASAAIEGMLSSSAPFLAVMDADLQHDEALLPLMLEQLRESEDDIVVGSRYIANASTGDLPQNRVRISRFATKLADWLLGCQLSDVMSGFFMLRREYLEKHVDTLYGKGFKILLDLISAGQQEVKLKELPYHMRARAHGESKLGFRVALEFIMLLMHKLIGRIVPPRFFLFALVGLSGVAVHMGVLKTLYSLLNTAFMTAQITATLVAMTSNYLLNNQITYADRKLKGKALLTGLISFYIACSIGAMINIAVAELLFSSGVVYWTAGLAGVLVSAIWNYSATSTYTWSGDKET